MSGGRGGSGTTGPRENGGTGRGESGAHGRRGGNTRRFRARGRRRTGRDLGPTARERLAALLPRAPVARGSGLLLARRIAAVALFVLAGALALLPATGSQVQVVVAAHDLAPGRPLDAADLRHRDLPADLVPSGALRDPAAAVGRAPGGAVRDGEPLTDVRLATAPERPPEVAAAPGQVAVPVRLADPGVGDLLHPGARVDLVTPQERSGPGTVLAERVPVLAVHPTGSGADQGRLLVVGVPEQRAAAVAGASLIHSVTVTLR